MKKGRIVVGVLVVVLLVAAVILLSRRAAVGGKADPLSMLSTSCEAVVVLPDPAGFGQKTALLQRLRLVQLASGLAGADVDSVVAQVARELGWDPRSAKSMEEAGIDPSRPVVAALSKTGPPLLLMPAKDPAKLEEMLAKQASVRLGATVRAEGSLGAARVVTMSRKDQGGAAMSWTAHGAWMLVATGSEAPALLRSVVEQKPETSLASNASLAKAREAMEGADAWAFACPGSKLTTSFDLAYGAGFGMWISEKELRLSSLVPLTDSQANGLASLATPVGAELVGKLDPESFLVARLGGDPKALKPYSTLLIPPFFSRALEMAGVDVGEEVLGNLAPGVAAGLTLAPTAQMAEVPDFDPRRTNPFRYVRLAAYAKVLDPAKAEATVAKIVPVGPKFGTTLERKELDGAKVVTATYQLGEGASFALKDANAVASGGEGQMEAALARLAGRAPGLDPRDAAAKKALAESGFVLWLDVIRLTTSVRALPDSAYGVGGFAIKAAISRWLDAVEEITSIRLDGTVADKALRSNLSFSLSLKPAEKPAQ